MSAASLRVYAPTRRECGLVTERDDLVSCFLRHNRGRAGVDLVSRPDEADLILLFEQFAFRLERHVLDMTRDAFFATHADRIYTVNYDDTGRGFLPGCHTSLHPENFHPFLHRACSYPYAYNEFTGREEGPNPEPRYLFSFRGLPRSAPVREHILAVLAGHPGGSVTAVDQKFHEHTPEQKSAFVREILESRFVLCPRGWSPSTHRLFEVMQLGRCPVILSDAWIPIAGVDWESCTIRVAEREVERLPGLLSVRAGEAAALGRQAAAVWREHFSEAARYRSFLSQILELHSARSNPSVNALFGLASMEKRWASWRFRRGNGWTASQKAARKLKKFLRLSHPPSRKTSA